MFISSATSSGSSGGWGTEAFSSQLRDIFCPLGSGSTMGASPSWTVVQEAAMTTSADYFQCGGVPALL